MSAASRWFSSPAATDARLPPARNQAEAHCRERYHDRVVDKVAATGTYSSAATPLARTPRPGADRRASPTFPDRLWFATF
jgi:hypothetical protein